MMNLEAFGLPERRGDGVGGKHCFNHYGIYVPQKDLQATAGFIMRH
jgi:hypothetical protein